MLQALRNKDPIGVPNGWPAIVAAAYAPLANLPECRRWNSGILVFGSQELQLEGQSKINRGTSLTVYSGSSMPRQTARAVGSRV